jgi:anti-anti-sigma factor
VPFRVVESRDPDGRLRIALTGELDLAVADRFSARLAQLSSDRVDVRLDLSGLVFVDSSGIRAMIEAVQRGRQYGDQLVLVLVEAIPEVTRTVLATLDLVGVGPVLWPTNDSPNDGAHLAATSC